MLSPPTRLYAIYKVFIDFVNNTKDWHFIELTDDYARAERLACKNSKDWENGIICYTYKEFTEVSVQ